MPDLNGSELEAATETLYRAFQVPKPTELNHGPFSIQASEAQFLLREPLRELHADILRSYLFEADEHPLYFLPRLLELAATDQLDAEMVLERLGRIQAELTAHQKAALADFNRVWWLDLLGRPTPIWTVLTLLEHDQDVPARLREWRANTGTQAALHLAHVLWWELGRTQRHDHLHDWLAEAVTEQRLEHAFFADPDATELSDALKLWRGHVLGIWGSEA